MLATRTFVAIAFGLVLLAPLPASAQVRPDPLMYSGHFWPDNSIIGRTVHKRTKYGMLVCSGRGVNGSTNRNCYWK